MKFNWLIPNLGDKEKNTRASIFVYIIIFTILLLLGLFLINHIYSINSSFPFLPVIILEIIIVFLFRFTGSFLITGNILALCLTYAMFNLSTKTGGIFSEDTHSVYIIPLIAFLIAGMRSGLVWFIAAFCWILYSHYLAGSPDQIDYFRNQTKQYDKNYYLVISLMNLFLVCLSISILRIQYFKLFSKFEENENNLEIQKSKLEATQKELEASNKELDQYAHSTAHDLKQPIRTIHSFTSLLDKELKKPSSNDSKIEEYIDIVKTSASNMNQLVIDLLEYSQLGHSDKKILGDVSLEKVIDNIQNNLRDLIVNTNTSLNIPSLPTVYGSRIHLNQLFQNLISNSIKFRAENKDPIISIRIKETDTDYIFSLSDNGIGIKEANLDAIFTPFKKLHSASQYEGSGIGLATCSKIVEMHGGKIWVESKIGKGSTFHFNIKKKIAKN